MQTEYEAKIKRLELDLQTLNEKYMQETNGKLVNVSSLSAPNYTNRQQASAYPQEEVQNLQVSDLF